MTLIDKDALMKSLGITSDECEKCDMGDGTGYCTQSSDFTGACDAILTALPVEVLPCENCQHRDKDWHEEPCDSCTFGARENHFEPWEGEQP